jgi:hypothetical protein
VSGGIAAGSLVLTLLGGSHVAGAGPLPLGTLPPLPLPSLLPTILPPLPTPPPLPVPTLPPLPVPTLPPLPSLPLPTVPVPSLPVPSVPVPTPPLPSLPLPSVPGSSPLAGAGGGPGTVQEPTGGDRGGSPFSFALPLLIAGIPLAIILLIVVAQVAGGAVWLPVIRRWLNRRLTPDP